MTGVTEYIYLMTQSSQAWGTGKHLLLAQDSVHLLREPHLDLTSFLHCQVPRRPAFIRFLIVESFANKQERKSSTAFWNDAPLPAHLIHSPHLIIYCLISVPE